MLHVVVLPDRHRAAYVYRNAEEHLCNHCCSRKTITITYSEYVFVAAGIQHAMCMRRVIIVICGLSGYIIYFHIIS
jgi:hypothetical protein